MLELGKYIWCFPNFIGVDYVSKKTIRIIYNILFNLYIITQILIFSIGVVCILINIFSIVPYLSLLLESILVWLLYIYFSCLVLCATMKVCHEDVLKNR